MGNCITAVHSFHSFEESVDVIFVVEKTKFPAHRALLSMHSDYFKTMFNGNFKEAKLNKIILKETNVKAFTRVLEYIYIRHMEYLKNHKIKMEEAFEVLACAKFYMVDALVVQLIPYLKDRGKANPRLFLHYALAYRVDEFISYGTYLILKQDYSHGIRLFDQMSPISVEHFLKLRLSAPETVIFKEFVYWMRQNPKFSSAFPELLKYIELHLLDKADLNMLFYPKPLIDREFLENLLSQQLEQAAPIHIVVDKSVINGVRLVEGRKTSSDNNLVSLRPENCITVDLKKRFLLNCIKFKLVDSMFYTVSVSNDMRDWECVIDYSKYDCFGQQKVYFTERAVRFIRIQCVPGDLKIKANIEALYSSDLPEIDPATNVIIPKSNLIPSKRLYERNSGSWVAGEVVDYFGDGIIYQFMQPYLIENMKLLLNEIQTYYIDISSDQKCWKRVFAQKEVSGWRTATFPKQPVVFIKITGTRIPLRGFRLCKLECPATLLPIVK
uniref:BTB domain-containing protein n=1 Tax=Panagrellus redivivus TaxID=6233 RepID=A0A7E4WBE1_PANRE